MKIISRYVLREHLGPLVFALTALTSLMLLNFISRNFGELVGKGLPWPVIGEFFLLSVPFTLALTVPMSVLVAVLYAYSRLASENEVTALKASGVSPWRLVAPAIGGGIAMSIALLAFNDQVLPPTNHRLKTLQEDISQAKPTLLLKEQVINPLAEGKFYLKAGKIDRAGGKMREVVIYDLGDPTRRRTIYADSGRIAFAANRVDLDMELYSGQMQEVSTEKPGQLDRLFYDRDRIRIRDVGRDFRQSKADSSSRSDREMGVCEMQKRLWQAESGYRAAERDYEEALKAPKSGLSSLPITAPAETKTPEPHGIGWAYCRILEAVFGVREAQAAGVDDAGLHPVILPQQGAAQDTTKKDTASKQDAGAGKNATPKAAPKPATPATSEMVFINGKLVSPPPPGQLTPVPGAIQQTAQPVPGAPGTPATDTAHAAGAHVQDSIAAAAAAEIMRQSQRPPAPGELGAAMTARTAEAKLRLDLATHSRNRYEIEIHKKFSLAAACLIFVMVAAPLAVRFPRGGVGLVIGVSLVVFAVYYVGLIGGESLANKGIVPPFWAMWGTNVIMTAIGIVLLFRMGRDQSSGRGGDFGDRIDAVRRWFGGLGRRRRPAGAA